MLNLLQDYEKPVKVNGKVYPDGKIAYATYQRYKGKVTIELNFDKPKPSKTIEEYKLEIVKTLT